MQHDLMGGGGGENYKTIFSGVVTECWELNLQHVHKKTWSFIVVTN